MNQNGLLGADMNDQETKSDKSQRAELAHVADRFRR
jgi:hypothetical protein